MPLSSRVKNKVIDAVNQAFSSIGAEAHTRPPKTRDNLGPIAWEYFVSWHLLSRAKARLEGAKKQCIKAGIIFDHEKFPREPGEGGLIYSGEQVGVMLTVKSAGTRTDIDKFCAALKAKGVKEHIVDECRTEAEYSTRPAHEFRPTLVVSDTITNGK